MTSYVSRCFDQIPTRRNWREKRFLLPAVLWVEGLLWSHGGAQSTLGEHEPELAATQDFLHPSPHWRFHILYSTFFQYSTEDWMLKCMSLWGTFHRNSKAGAGWEKEGGARKVFVAKSHDLSSVPGTCRVGGETWLHRLSFVLHTKCSVTHFVPRDEWMNEYGF